MTDWRRDFFGIVKGDSAKGLNYGPTFHIFFASAKRPCSEEVSEVVNRGEGERVLRDVDFRGCFQCALAPIASLPSQSASEHVLCYQETPLTSK